MQKNNQIEFISPSDFVEHPLHARCFQAADKKANANYHESIGKYGKIKQVVYILKQNKKLVIDGWAYIQYAVSKGLKEVAAKMVDVTSDEDITRLMLELQFSSHSSPQEEYQIYSAAFDIFSKGKGHRSDLKEQNTDAERKKRRQVVYDKIAEMTNASSGKRVQYILKIGKVNPEYLERMVLDKMSLQTAYLNCIAEERGDAPEPPTVKAPVYLSNTTGTYPFEKSIDTNTPANINELTTGSAAADVTKPPIIDGKTINKNIAIKSEENEDGIVTCICTHCGQETVVNVSINNTKK